MRHSRKLAELLRLIQAGAGQEGIYALAGAAGRPYRRVHAQVRLLAASGQVRLTSEHRGSRSRIRVTPVGNPAPLQQFDRAWSRPSGGIDIDTSIALVLARPTFGDLLGCCIEYGIVRVRDVFARMIATLQLDPKAAAESGRILSNIEIGHARAAAAN